MKPNRTACFQSSLMIIAIRIYSELPLEIKKVNSIMEFKLRM